MRWRLYALETPSNDGMYVIRTMDTEDRIGVVVEKVREFRNGEFINVNPSERIVAWREAI